MLESGIFALMNMKMTWGYKILAIATAIIAVSAYAYFTFMSGHYMVEHIDPIVSDKISLVVLKYWYHMALRIHIGILGIRK